MRGAFGRGVAIGVAYLLALVLVLALDSSAGPVPIPVATPPVADAAAQPTDDAVPAPIEPSPSSEFPTPAPAILPPWIDPVGLALDPDAPMPSPSEIAAAVETVIGGLTLGADPGIEVRDLLTDEVLYAASATNGHVPASTTKILTAFAATESLDPGMTLDTSVVIEQADGPNGPTEGSDISVGSGEAAHQIVLIGGGDMFLADDVGNPTGVVGHAGLGDLARQAATALLARGIDTVALSYVDDMFISSQPSVGLAVDQANGEIAPIVSLATNGGQPPAPEGDTPSPTPTDFVYDPVAAAARTFAERLSQAGVAVTGGIGRRQAPGGGGQISGEVIGVVHSAPIAALVEYDVVASDNTLSEVLGRLVAIARGAEATLEQAAAAVMDVLAESGRLDTTGLDLRDCSGLDKASRVTPRLLTQIIALTAQSGPHTATSSTVIRALPVAGSEGTLIKRLVDPPAAGNVRAKTGTLTGVTSLAGTLQTRGGRVLVFAIMADGVRPPDQPVSTREAIDTFVGDLTRLGG